MTTSHATFMNLRKFGQPLAQPVVNISLSLVRPPATLLLPGRVRARMRRAAAGSYAPRRLHLSRAASPPSLTRRLAAASFAPPRRRLLGATPPPPLGAGRTVVSTFWCGPCQAKSAHNIRGPTRTTAFVLTRAAQLASLSVARRFHGSCITRLSSQSTAVRQPWLRACSELASGF